MRLLYQRNMVISSLLVLAMVLLAACSASTTQVAKPTATPVQATPTPGQGQQLLTTTGNKLTAAQTLHGIFNLTITGQTLSGTINSETWNAKPDKNRTLTLQSTVPQFSETGAVTVTDGKQVWQYDPQKKVVYNGPVANNAGGTANGGTGRSGGGGQSQFFLTLIQTVFTRSDATLTSSSDTVNGHNVYTIHVVPQQQATGTGAGNFNYTGDVFIDKSTQLPVRVKLNIQGLGDVQLDLPTLELNPTIPATTFTFIVPAGVKVLPLSAATTTPNSGSLTLAQAQQSAGYHLLSIASNQTGYTLLGVNALGAPGNQTYTLNYMQGGLSFTVAQGKSLANLPGSGQQVSVRGSSGNLASSGGTTTLTWTEKGVGIIITGALSSEQIQAIAKLLQ